MSHGSAMNFMALAMLLLIVGLVGLLSIGVPTVIGAVIGGSSTSALAAALAALMVNFLYYLINRRAP